MQRAFILPAVLMGMLITTGVIAAAATNPIGPDENPTDAMAIFQEIALKGDIKRFRAIIHPKKGLRDEGARVPNDKIDEQYMVDAPFLRAARSGKAARCDSRFRGGKAKCDIVVSHGGGYRYRFVRTKVGVFLVSAWVFDG